ncbi:MAG: MerR family transcriptional regulator [Dehalococcoidia bacterium]|nr:MerR family transcriptional regulator [Dehalococcoidia bacterium]MCA9826457.1 MerR family transcriptional regulator [Dehalococcoidia bacterium]MCA9845263.1 MerR family transcriptional regulator [Dehalococcoidia bacterium]MCA9854406.1 MerR family transcriptional regulator [Dehalococcoidia bacterium]
MTEDRPSNEGFLQIGEAAEQTGLTQRTLRYYEEKGLLRPPSRMDGGFRLYSQDDIERVENIRQLKELLGFSLADIKEMIEAEDVRIQVKAQWRKDAAIAEKVEEIKKALAATRHQVELIDQKVAKMTEMREQLATRAGNYERWLAEREVPAIS